MPETATYAESPVPLGLFPLELTIEISEQRVEFAGQIHVFMLIPCLDWLAWLVRCFLGASTSTQRLRAPSSALVVWTRLVFHISCS